MNQTCIKFELNGNKSESSAFKSDDSSPIFSNTLAICRERNRSFSARVSAVNPSDGIESDKTSAFPKSPK